MTVLDETRPLQSLVDRALKRHASGLNYGMSGNVSVRIARGC